MTTGRSQKIYGYDERTGALSVDFPVFAAGEPACARRHRLFIPIEGNCMTGKELTAC
jgi:hypothetical protein